MRIAIIGSGSIALGSAALLSSLGHSPVIASRSLPAGTISIDSSGAVAGRFAAEVAPTLDVAVGGVGAVLLAVPGWAHRASMEALAPLLTDGQAVLVSSHASLGALYLHRLLAARGCRALVAGWGTTVVTGRRTGPTACRVANVRAAVDAAAVPASRTGEALAVCRALFGDRFVPRANLLAIQLSNLNPQNHLAMLLCNLTRAERGEDWGNYWAITPAVGRLMEALDVERLALAARFGVEVRTVRDHFHLSFQLPLAPVWEQAAALDARGGAPLGPKSLDTRYISEDVPFGIAATEWLGRRAGVPVPLHAGGTEMFCALMGQDLRAQNDLLPALSLDEAGPEDLLAAVS